MEDFTNHVIHTFKQHRDSERAAQMQAYMKDLFPFIGIMSTPRKALTRDVYNAIGTPLDALTCAKELWDCDEREFQYVGQEMLVRCHKQWDESFVEDIEWFVTHKSWWDTVDYLASNVAGRYFQKFPDQTATITSHWNKSDNMWLVRTSILFQLKYRLDTNPDLLAKYILRHSHQKEFFIKKAIGWALREYAKYNKQWVSAFVTDYELQPLSYKEATKHF